MDENRRQQKLTGLQTVFSRYKYVLLVAALGVLLLLWPQGQQAAPVPSTTATSDTDTLEKDMESILSRIRGVGQVDVMLTVQSGSELVLASDSTLRYSGVTTSPDDYDRTSEVVTVSGQNGGQDVVVTQERSPQYRGALVVCQGGGNDSVRLQVVEAVSALTGLGSDRIAVVPWADIPEKQEEPK